MTDLISSDFTFTQSNMQTFNYCRRRFYLRYIRKLIWPAQLVNDPQYAQDRDAGVRFHQIVHQHFLGLDAALLRKVAEADPDPRLSAWLADFLTSQMPLLDGELFPEALFNTSIANHPLSAKVDLLQIKAGVVKIFDWKTSRQLPNLATLKKQVQSKVYPLVVSRVFSDNDLDHLTMVYWEANFPEQTIEITSSRVDWQKYEREITTSIDLILSMEAEEFILTPDAHKCAWCEYRSYCQRGKAALNSEELHEDLIDNEMKIPTDSFDSWGPV